MMCRASDLLQPRTQMAAAACFFFWRPVMPWLPIPCWLTAPLHRTPLPGDHAFVSSSVLSFPDCTSQQRTCTCVVWNLPVQIAVPPALTQEQVRSVVLPQSKKDSAAHRQHSMTISCKRFRHAIQEIYRSAVPLIVAHCFAKPVFAARQAC